ATNSAARPLSRADSTRSSALATRSPAMVGSGWHASVAGDCVRDEGVAGSNPVSPTTQTRRSTGWDMMQAVGVILSVMSLAYLVVMFVVQRPSLRKLAQLAREARRGESWPQTARGLSVAQRIRLARRTATGKPPADDTEAALLVARARFLLHVRDYL